MSRNSSSYITKPEFMRAGSPRTESWPNSRETRRFQSWRAARSQGFGLELGLLVAAPRRERWIRERRVHRNRTAMARAGVAVRADRDGDPVRAVRWARRLGRAADVSLELLHEDPPGGERPRVVRHERMDLRHRRGAPVAEEDDAGERVARTLRTADVGRRPRIALHDHRALSLERVLDVVAQPPERHAGDDGWGRDVVLDAADGDARRRASPAARDADRPAGPVPARDEHRRALGRRLPIARPVRHAEPLAHRVRERPRVRGGRLELGRVQATGAEEQAARPTHGRAGAALGDERVGVALRRAHRYAGGAQLPLRRGAIAAELEAERARTGRRIEPRVAERAAPGGREEGDCQGEGPGGAQGVGHSSRRPARARASVTWSAYSRSPPMGTPCAMRVTLIPIGLRSFER